MCSSIFSPNIFAYTDAGRGINGVASFNVSPASFGKYYSKLGCFCFEKQELKAGEKATYVMTFYLDPDLVNDPTTKNLQDVTMSYTFFSTDYYKQS